MLIWGLHKQNLCNIAHYPKILVKWYVEQLNDNSQKYVLLLYQKTTLYLELQPSKLAIVEPDYQGSHVDGTVQTN
jgi:hypothetical protein